MNLVIDTSPIVYRCVPFDKSGSASVFSRIRAETRAAEPESWKKLRNAGADIRIRYCVPRTGPAVRTRERRGWKHWNEESGAYTRNTREEYKRDGGVLRCTTPPRTTEIRRNFNIPWRAGNGAGCNPLDKRLPAPWCLLTNRGHRSRGGARGFRTKRADEKEKMRRIFRLPAQGRAGPSGSNPSCFAALCRRNKLLVPLRLVVSPRPRDNCIGRSSRARTPREIQRLEMIEVVSCYREFEYFFSFLFSFFFANVSKYLHFSF